MTTSVLIAAYYKRKITQTLPAAVAAFTVMFFFLGLTGRISHIVGAYLLCVAAADIVFGVLLHKRHALGDIRDTFDPGIVIWLILIILLIPAYYHAKVYNWDDFHYWAIYARNMFAVNGAPNGTFACTEYKDYMRGIQFLYFFVFKILGRYSESAMFFVNNALIVTVLMPFFERGSDTKGRYALRVAMGIMLPYLCMFQMLHCLGVDCIMTVMFGLGLWSVFDEKKDLFYYVRIACIMAALTVTKTAGLTFATVILAVFLIKEKRKPVALLCYLPSVLEFVLWKIYCVRKGNSTYLHEIVEQNVTGKNGFSFPDYAPKVIADYIRSFFTFRLNEGFFGFTPFVILCLFVAVFVMGRRERTRQDMYVFITITAGMVLYLLSVLYTYLFVFVRWEAESLSSYDRYVSNYMGAMLYLAVLWLFRRKIETGKLAVIAAICAATLNYGSIATHFIPSLYAKEYAGEFERKSMIENAMKGLAGQGIGEGETVGVVLPSGDDDLALYAQYYGVPCNILCLDGSAKDLAEDELIKRSSEEGASYLYFINGGKLCKINKQQW